MDNEKLIKTSPFCYRPGITAVLENRKTSCDAADIKSALYKEIIKDIDIYIIRTVFDFDLLNKNSLTFYLNHSDNIPDEIKKQDYTRNLHNLVERGILLRYSFKSEDNKSSPCVYILSKGADSYFSRMFGRGFCLKHRTNPALNMLNAETALKMIAFNQFFVRLLKSDIYIKNLKTDVCLNHGKTKLYMDALIRFKLNDDTYTDFAFISIRNTDNCTDMVNSYLELFCHQFKKKKVTLILMVESVQMAKNLENFRISKERLKMLNVFYLPDTVAINEYPLSIVYGITPQNGYSQVDEISFEFKKMYQTN